MFGEVFQEGMSWFADEKEQKKKSLRNLELHGFETASRGQTMGKKAKSLSPQDPLRLLN